MLQVSCRQEVAAGSEEEVEIRAASIVAVERIKEAIHARWGLAQGGLEGGPTTETPAAGVAAAGESEGIATAAGPCGVVQRPRPGLRLPLTIQLDWWLWEQGEKSRASHPPHHRTLTIYY